MCLSAIQWSNFIQPMESLYSPIRSEKLFLLAYFGSEHWMVRSLNHRLKREASLPSSWPLADVGVGYGPMIVTTKAFSASSYYFDTYWRSSSSTAILLGCTSGCVFARPPFYLRWRIMLGIGAAPPVLFTIAEMIEEVAECILTSKLTPASPMTPTVM